MNEYFEPRGKLNLIFSKPSLYPNFLYSKLFMFQKNKSNLNQITIR